MSFIREELDIRIDSFKSKLDDLFIEFNKDIDEVEKNILDYKGECVGKINKAEMILSMLKRKDTKMTQELFYEYQNVAKDLFEMNKQIEWRIKNEVIKLI